MLFYACLMKTKILLILNKYCLTCELKEITYLWHYAIRNLVNYRGNTGIVACVVDRCANAGKPLINILHLTYGSTHHNQETSDKRQSATHQYII